MTTTTHPDRRAVLRAAVLGAGGLAAAPLLAGCQGSAADRVPPAAPASPIGGPSSTAPRPSASPTAATGPAVPDPQIAGAWLRQSSVTRAAPSAAALRPGIDALWRFTGALAAPLLGERTDNVVCSPLSVHTALAMAALGARGQTEREMLTVLGAASPTELASGAAAVATTLAARAGSDPGPDGKPVEVLLTIANSLWGQRGVTWEQPFLDGLARSFGAGLHEVDYVRETETARRAINTWTDQQTHGLIPQLLGQGDLDSSARLTLVNALYLKAPWLLPFEKSSTQPGTFTGPAGAREVPLMRSVAERRIGSGPGWQAVTLPYARGGLAMTLVRAEQRGAAGAAALTDVVRAGLRPVIEGLRPGQVSLQMPRWRFRTQAELGTRLAALGMPSAFAAGADFSGMSVLERLQIAAVAHEGVVAVDEAGTEAAAATAVVMRAAAAPQPAVELVLDRPFLFVIHDIETTAPLLVGRVSEP